MRDGAVKVIFDTNVWISFLIGKKLSGLKRQMVQKNVEIVLSDQLLNELVLVSKRNKLKRYFPESKVIELVDFMRSIGKLVEVKSKFLSCEDPKDNFLLDLMYYSRADYLVTGDKAVLKLDPFENTRILNPINFEAELEKLFSK